jgi:hypothetical protein
MDSSTQSVHPLIARSATATIQIPLWSSEKPIKKEKGKGFVPGFRLPSENVIDRRSRTSSGRASQFGGFKSKRVHSASIAIDVARFEVSD